MPKWLVLIGLIALVNFSSFIAIDLYLGGSALNGKQENGKFYLSEHGRYTEVSETIFEYSKFHAYSMFATHALFLSLSFFRWISSPLRKN